jgi:serine/threonine protein kinase
MDDRMGQQFGPYRLVRLLGVGRFSKVYLGEHRSLGSQVALKLLAAELDEDQLARFLAEVRLLQQLDHPYIIRVRDSGIEHGVAFLCMDYASGGMVRALYPPGQQALV